MIPLTKLKKDVQFNGELTKVVDVLKGIAAARFHVLERQLSIFDLFFKVCDDFLGMVNFDFVDHPFTRPANEKVSVLMITSDGGFLGGLNNQVVTTGIRQGGASALLTVIGERGVAALRDIHKECDAFPGIQDPSRFPLALAVRDHLVRQILSGESGQLLVVYPKAVSFSVQKVVTETLLPFQVSVPQGKGRLPISDVLWESKPKDVVEYLVTHWMGRRLDAIFALSRLAELSARSVHLEGSFQELTHIGKKLRLHYFRARHEIIDRSMREIFAAQLLYGRQENEPRC